MESKNIGSGTLELENYKGQNQIFTLYLKTKITDDYDVRYIVSMVINRITAVNLEQSDR
jgi:hypothetical protein